MASLEQQIAAALARVDRLDHQGLLTVRAHAQKHGEAAAELIAAIDRRLAEFDISGGMAKHRLDFARAMLRKLNSEPVLHWVPAIDLFNRARLEESDNPFVVWMEGNSARKIPITKALEDVRPEFPDVDRKKDGTGRGDRVYFRRLR